MAIRTPPLYLQGGTHTAENDRLGITGMVTAEGCGPGTTELQVTQSGTPAMTVSVAAGHGWVNGTTSTTQGTYKTYNDAAVTLTIATANATLPRIDKVCLTVRDAAYAGSSNDCILQVITGTAAASPTAPATPASSLVLATVAVAAAATTIVNANITDTRSRAQMGLPLSVNATAQLTGIAESSVTNLVSDLAAKTDTAMVQNAQTGTSYSYALADASKLLSMSNAASNTVLVTKQATVTWVTGTQLRIVNLGTGVTTLVADTGVTINGNVALKQYQGGTLIRTASDVWLFVPTASSSGMDLITPTSVVGGTLSGGEISFSAAATVNVNGCFTSTYDAYQVWMQLSQSIAAALPLRMRAAGVDASGANYDYQELYAESNVVTAARNLSQTSARFAYASTDCFTTFNIQSPALAAITYLLSNNYYGPNSAAVTIAARHTPTTAYDGFSILSTGTITGKMRIYGMRKS